MRNLIAVLLTVSLLLIGVNAFAIDGSAFLSKVVDDSDVFKISGNLDFDVFYLKGDMGFRSDMNTIVSKDWEIGGDYDITDKATILGSYDVKESADKKTKSFNVALDTKITEHLMTRTQYKQTDSDGEVTLGIGLKFH